MRRSSLRSRAASRLRRRTSTSCSSPHQLAISRADATLHDVGISGRHVRRKPAEYWSTWNVNSIKYTFSAGAGREVREAHVAGELVPGATKFELQTSANGTTWTTQFRRSLRGTVGRADARHGECSGRQIRQDRRGAETRPRSRERPIAEVQSFRRMLPRPLRPGSRYTSALRRYGLARTPCRSMIRPRSHITATSTTARDNGSGSLTACFASSNPASSAWMRRGVVTRSP